MKSLNELLKPCPFCGGEAKFKTFTVQVALLVTVEKPACKIVCAVCGASTREYEDKDKDAENISMAITDWNRRIAEEEKGGTEE